MSDEVMNNLLALLQSSMEGSRMTTETTMQIIEGIGKGIQADTKRMENAVKRMEQVLENLSFLIGESVVVVPDSILNGEETVQMEVNVEMENKGMQSEQGKETYPVAFFYRSKVPGTHGTDGFYLVIDETEDELVYYVYDQNQKLVNTGKTTDKSLPIRAIEEMAINKEVLNFYSCYRMRPEKIEVQVSVPVKAPEEKATDTSCAADTKSLLEEAVREETLQEEIKQAAMSESRERPKTI